MITATRPDESGTYTCPACGQEHYNFEEPCSQADTNRADNNIVVSALIERINALTERVATLEKQARIARNQASYRATYGVQR